MVVGIPFLHYKAEGDCSLSLFMVAQKEMRDATATEWKRETGVKIC